MDKYLVVGLGSMGKRRVRCLLALGVPSSNIYGLDVREDRREEATHKYGIVTVKDESEVEFDEIRAVIVSLPPDKHHLGAEIAARHNKSVFVEASVVLSDALRIKEICSEVFVAPSTTLHFHPMIKEIRRIVKSGELGKVCNFSYHSGQFLPDWHPWENVNDFYVSNRITGGAREIVPFELTWMVEVFGFPNDVKGYFRKTGKIGCDIEDSYATVLSYDDMIGALFVDVIGRYPARNLIINLQDGQIQWKWDEEKIQVYDALRKEMTYIEQPEQIHEPGYSPMIGEQMYVDEIAAFLNGMNSRDSYPNSIDNDIKILEILMKIEDSDGGFGR